MEKESCHLYVSTTVEIFLYYLTKTRTTIYRRSTTVEIILYYLTGICFEAYPISTTVEIFYIT